MDKKYVIVKPISINPIMMQFWQSFRIDEPETQYFEAEAEALYSYALKEAFRDYVQSKKVNLKPKWIHFSFHKGELIKFSNSTQKYWRIF